MGDIEVAKEILMDAFSRIDAGVELAPAQRIVLREWWIGRRARLSELQLRSQKGMLSDELYAEMAALVAQVEKFRQIVEKG